MTNEKEVAVVAFESNLAKGERLFTEKADDARVLREYTKSYKLKNKTDKKWIAARAKIYMAIAERKLSK